MYGKCGQLNGFDQLCYVAESEENKPKAVSDESFEVLKRYCSDTLEEYDYTKELCCSDEQIPDLITQLQMPEGLIARCPSCFYNFRKVFCEFTCSPYQRYFLNVTEENREDSNGNNPPHKQMVTVVDYFISQRFVDAAFDSCKDVVFSPTNGYAMDTLCG